LAATRELGLDDKLAELGFNGPQQAAALGNIIARMLAPASERASAQWLARDSGLGELIGYEFESMSLHRLYDASDRLLRHKAALEAHLYERERTLFDLGDTITLYDLTNTFFEGDARANELAARGHSKDKRFDRCLVTLGLVLDRDGFPKRSEIFAGNAGEAATLAQMLDGLGAPAGSTVVVDAGIASQANLEWLVAQGYHYLVVTRQRRGEIDAELAETLTTRGGETLRVQRELDDDTGEVRVDCESPRRREKEQAMQQRSGERFEQGLRQIAEGLHKKGGTKRYDKVVERLGRLKERHARAAQHYRVHIERDGATDKACSIDWEYAPAGASRATHPGVYCLRSDLTDWSEAALWRTYTLLTDVEEAFRSLKSELGLRPIHHQTSERVRAHRFISVLAYHRVHTIRCRLKAHGINERWATLRAQLASQRRVTATLNDRDGSTWHIRKAMRPEPEERAIYDALGLDHHPGTTLKQRVA
jgi:transposase